MLRSLFLLNKRIKVSRSSRFSAKRNTFATFRMTSTSKKGGRTLAGSPSEHATISFVTSGWMRQMYGSAPQPFHVCHLVSWDSIEMASKDSFKERLNLHSCKKLFKDLQHFSAGKVASSSKMGQFQRPLL